MSTPFIFDPQKIKELDKFMATFFAAEPSEKTSLATKNRELLHSVLPTDLFFLAWFSDDSPIPLRDLVSRAGKIVNLFHHGLENFGWNRECAGMMIRLRKENATIEKELTALTPLISQMDQAPIRHQLWEKITQFSEMEKKFSKAENLLYPILETKIPSHLPLRVLWMVHDDIRKAINDFVRLLSSSEPAPDSLRETVGVLFDRLIGLLEKEELILYPVASLCVSEEEWESMEQEALAIGYAFGADPVAVHRRYDPQPERTDRFSTPTGEIQDEVLEAILNMLPVELTYIDENNRICYFNESAEKLFTRTPQIIGRDVELCHPEKSIPVIRKMIAAFKAGESDQATIYETIKGRFVVIRYCAVRDRNHAYRGILEIVQDATPLRALNNEDAKLHFEPQK
jgi:hypothetical protein